MTGIGYMPHMAGSPVLPQDMSSRCASAMNFAPTEALDCTRYDFRTGVYPESGYIVPKEPAHQKSGSSGKPKLADMASAMQAIIRGGEAKSTVSGKAISPSSSSLCVGSNSDM